MTIFIPESQYARSPNDCVEEVGYGLKLVRHPLYCGFPMPSDAASALGAPTMDEIVEHKRQRLKEAAEKRDVHKYVWLHERPWRFHALLDARVWTEHKEWMGAAGGVWVDSEGPGVSASVWRSEVFMQPDAKLTMEEDDLAFYMSLPDPLNIYRGAATKKDARRGLSWTTNYDKAVWFARRFRRKRGYVAHAVVPKSAVAAAFAGRGECEVVMAALPRGCDFILQTV